jgi:glycosyltransferase involved in cell wall biosynthesis
MKEIDINNLEILLSLEKEKYISKLSKNLYLVVQPNLNLGQRKQFLIDKATGDWILILDTDEQVSPELGKEIRKILSNPNVSKGINGYRIPYQNYVFGHPVYYGGEKYSKVRLFRNGKGRVSQVPLHEEVEVDGKIVNLRGVIHHHSYRNPVQLYAKFIKYAWTASRMKKKNGEKVTLKKLFLYGPHMFWARFVKDEGYKDGYFGFVLAKAFGFMEMMTCWFMLL